MAEEWVGKMETYPLHFDKGNREKKIEREYC